LARPDDSNALDLPEREEIPVSGDDGIAPGNDGCREDVGVLGVSEPRKPAETLRVGPRGNHLHTEDRQGFLRFRPKT